MRGGGGGGSILQFLFMVVAFYMMSTELKTSNAVPTEALGWMLMLILSACSSNVHVHAGSAK